MDFNCGKTATPLATAQGNLVKIASTLALAGIVSVAGFAQVSSQNPGV
jgi:hypothetical protein